LGALTDIVLKSRESNATPPVTLCKVTVPLLLGLCRSVGRYATSNPPLLCRLFPRPAKPTIRSTDPNQQLNLNEACKNSYYTNFRPIIPRSMSGSLNAECIEPQIERREMKKNHLISFYSVPYDPTTHFFTKFGSSFNQFPNMRTYDHYSSAEEENPKKVKTKVPFPVNHLQRIFDLSKKLLTKELLQHLDEQAEDIFQLNLVSCVSRYGYKSFSEIITLVIVTLLREILQNQTGELLA
jgi:phosphatidylinositol 4-kinase